MSFVDIDELSSTEEETRRYYASTQHRGVGAREKITQQPLRRLSRGQTVSIKGDKKKVMNNLQDLPRQNQCRILARMLKEDVCLGTSIQKPLGFSQTLGTQDQWSLGVPKQP